jgi:SOS-response transcriptional repressor LexA
LFLTSRKRMIMKAIQEHVAQYGYPPTIRELCCIVGLKSSSAMHRHLEDLRKVGILTWEPSRPRTLAVVERDANAF